MQTHLQRIEGKRAINGDDQFAIQHKCLRRDGTQISSTSGKKRDSDLPDLALISTSPPARNARHRKPSHLGSNCQPTFFGSSVTSLASIGERSSGIPRSTNPVCRFLAASVIALLQ